MLNNRIRVRIDFDFKGKTHSPAADLDLDNLMQQHGDIPSLHELVAAACSISPYSYEYDVLLSEALIFEEASGFTAEFIRDGWFDAEAFAERWHKEFKVAEITRIAAQHLGVESLDRQPALKAALLESWEEGRRAGRREQLREQ
ncbi:MAG TPA: hypothetical protein VNI58_06450 [Mariprofundaceae bacterium]|nr:hypothetical protein [Mariprofundaceae bacterium]